jgi:hypothetical protein
VQDAVLVLVTTGVPVFVAVLVDVSVQDAVLVLVTV